LVEALPKMAKAAHASELKNAFTSHLKETEGHVNRLEKIFEAFQESPRGETCKAIKDVIAEGEEAIEEDAEAAIKDAALIAAAQRVEHYEMAGYGTVRTCESVEEDRCRQAPPANPGRGRRGRQEADLAGRDAHQPPGQVIRPSLVQRSVCEPASRTPRE